MAEVAEVLQRQNLGKGKVELYEILFSMVHGPRAPTCSVHHSAETGEAPTRSDGKGNRALKPGAGDLRRRAACCSAPLIDHQAAQDGSLARPFIHSLHFFERDNQLLSRSASDRTPCLRTTSARDRALPHHAARVSAPAHSKLPRHFQISGHGLKSPCEDTCLYSCDRN
jgi:hypothetical protein